ncbi:MAG TPA: DUF6580 family putative transport protein [Gemmatimonadaceae bacterium]
MSDAHRSRLPWLAGTLILIGILARLLPHPWNASPIAAIALFSGAMLRPRWGMLVPLAAVAASDLVLGWHVTIPFTWGSFALIGALGWWVRSRPDAGRILMGTVAGSCVFFLVTNFGVWALHPDWYPHSPAGLWQCYAAAVPFFRATLAGDLVYAAALFGGYAWATRPRAFQPAGAR